MEHLDSMRVFVRVAELASFTQAADSLGLPKASVSSAVQQLEARLGARLLQRTTRRVQLSDDGRVYYERCRDLLADMDELNSLFCRDDAPLSGRVRVDMPVGVARHAVLPRLPEFLARHPGLSVELSSVDRRVDVLREEFDCVLRVGALHDSTLVARRLGVLRQINCASPDYLARHGQPETLADLARHQLVHYTPGLGGKPAGFEYQDADGALHTVAMAGALTVNASDAYTAACLAGLGLIQVPLAGVRGHLQRGELVPVLPDCLPPALPVHLLYPNRRHLPRRVRAWMDWLAEVMADYLA